MKNLFLVISFIPIALFTKNMRVTIADFDTVSFKSADGLTVRADVYGASNEEAPVILLFHQAGYSRGEYRSIAPRLTELGFTCVAVDQRSGKEVNGVENETFKEATSQGKATGFLDALQDLVAAIKYVNLNYPDRKIVLWGSSYSASLVLILGSEGYPNISALVAFSPGEYFEYKNKKVKDFANALHIPVFFSSAKNEYDRWKEIYAVINTPKQYYLPTENGIHGSKALWESSAGNEKNWESLTGFLKQIK